jgi:RHS repeat-associated protein
MGNRHFSGGGYVGYTGHVWNDSTKLSYAHARYLNHESKVWLSVDPFSIENFSNEKFLLNPQAQNSYAYANNNPINNVDEDGKFAHVLVGAGVGAAAGVTVQLIDDMVFKGKSFEELDWREYVGAAAGGAVQGAVISGTAGIGWVGVAGGNAGGDLVKTYSTAALKGELQKVNLGEAVTHAGFNGAFGVAGSKVPGLVGMGGRGSIESVTKSTMTKLANGKIGGMSIKTGAKIFTSNFVGDISTNVFMKPVDNKLQSKNINVSINPNSQISAVNTLQLPQNNTLLTGLKKM